MTVVELMRDATAQRLADWTDVRFGMGCFAIARSVLTVSGLCATAAPLALRALDDSPEVQRMVYEGMVMSLTAMVLAAALRAVEARMSERSGPGVIRPLRHWLPLSWGFASTAVSLSLATFMALSAVRVLLSEQPLGPARPWAAAMCVLSCGALLFPTALIFASCQWRRLRRAPEAKGRLAGSAA